MNYTYTKIIENGANKEAVMTMFGQIGRDINGDLFASELKSLSGTGVESCRIKINSLGGNVFQGYSILASMQMLKDSGIKVITDCVGVAYSMAGMVLSAGTEKTIVDYGTVMVHDPFFGGNAGKNEMLTKVTDSLRMILVSNSSMDEETAKEYMSKETTFSAKEAKKVGIVDSVIKTGKTIQNFTNAMATMEACANIYNQQKIKQMKEVAEKLGLNAEANETAILNAVSQIMDKSTKAESIVNEKIVLDAKVLKLEAENKALKEGAVKQKAEALVANAITLGRISEDAKEVWIENAVQSYETTEKMLESFKVVAPASINDGLDGKEGQKADKGLADKYEALLDTPELLDSMPKEEVKKMEEAYELLHKVDTTRE